MTEVAGRPIFAALQMLLSAERLFTLPDKQRLPYILAESRKYQNLVSTKLAEQVLAALYELLRGFQAADDQRHGELLRDVLKDDPNQVYAGLLRVLLRLVFILYAEDRSLLSNDEVYQKYYSVIGLFERLREDAGRYTDTMDHRFGAWAQLLTLFRLIYDGGRHGGLKLLPRKGYLFDPDRYPFLEGRGVGSGELGSGDYTRPPSSQIQVPRVSDGVVFRVLQNLLILDGERLSYRTLDVEQIGSVYETMMGFNLEVAQGRSIAIKPTKPHSAPTTINLEELLAAKPADRAKWLKEKTDQSLTGQAAAALKGAATPEDAVAALERKVAFSATPRVVPAGAMVLQPSDERRRSGSHYTPRTLTEPIVETTLRPILERLGVGRSDLGGGGRKEGHSGRQDPLVSRPQSVATGDGPGSGMLPGDQGLSPGGDVWIDQPDSASGGGDSREHRGGTRSRVEEGIPTIPSHSTGEPSRAGNTLDAQRSRRSDAGSHIEHSASDRRSTRPDAQLSAAGTPNPTPQLLAPNSFLTPEQILDLKVCDPAMGSGAFLVAVCRLLADLLVRAWHAHKCVPTIPPDEDEILHARRIVAQRCLYGVDKNPMAVDLAKLSLWLATLAKDHPFTFLDHALKCGDSLVGLSKSQILGFHWKPEKQRDFARAAIEGQLSRALEQRRQIREAPDGTSEVLLKERLQAADGFLNPGRRYGDLVVSAFFAADNDRRRRERLESLSDDLAAQRSQFDVARHQRLEEALGELRRGPHPVVPFHWEIEFPEVFDRTNPGFDAFVGNPPFLHGKKITGNFGDGLKDWLALIHEETNSNADMVAHFFRRSFNMLRMSSAFGLISTNTISQGDTRYTGLRWICSHGGSIFAARKRISWPGQAAVSVSIIYVFKGIYASVFELDGKVVPVITAFLFHAGGHENPYVLQERSGQNFQGSIILGMGFTFDDTDSSGVSSPIAEMNRLIEKEPRNAQCIRPYIGGEELNESPIHANHRFVINFGNMSKDEAQAWPDLFAIVEAKVKPQRSILKKPQYRDRWWQFAERQTSLYEALKGHRETLVNSQTSTYMAFSYVPSDWVYSNALNVFPLESKAVFSLMQNRVHEVWARFFASSLEDRLRYTPSDCFETFPFPANFETVNSLEVAGRAYHDFRAALMIRNNEGLTKTYNRFHDPDERSPDILKLRELHAAMDWAVLDAYGWTDLKPACEFLLDYEDEEDQELATSNQELPTRRRRKPWRYRWPDDFRDEVLARLLELNRQRAEEERLSGAAESGRRKSTKKSTKGRKADTKKPDQPEFFES